MSPAPSRRRRASAGLAAAVAALLAPAASSLTANAAEPLQFNRDIRPILADACFRCHGPAAKKAGLRLDDPDSALKPAESGEVAVVPGKPDASELVRRVLSHDKDEVMPPPSSKKVLTDAQKATLRAWVAQGAPYQKHWSFETPVKPHVPAAVPGAEGRKNPVDAFLDARLAREGLTPGPEADRPTLIRRLAFTLTGLPPTAREVDDFVRDSSSRAYENLVERYLFSPRFGEEMARHWLDVARYADTHGLHLDNERQMWLYRDWVVRAFNDNVPFDEFTVAQVAGDLLPKPTPDQLVATGFSRCNVTTGEGGSIDSEWVFRNAVDRASTMSEAWMGLTAGCAVCHDHKFDPITSEDFYSLYSFFYSAAGAPLDGNVLVHEPSVKVAAPEQSARVARLEREVKAAREALAAKEAGLIYVDPADEKGDKLAAAAADPVRSFRAWLGSVKPEAADLPKPVQELVKKSKSGKLDDAGRAELKRHYLRRVCVTTRDTLKPLADAADRLGKERAAAEAEIPASYVFREMTSPRDSFVMMRGQYDKPGKKVEPGTPKSLPPLKRAAGSDRATRLDLARWLVAPEHPLTARVAVNRVWQQVFGTGLVKTSYDFGTQGEPPSHPELLDWLAVTYRESGWDTKALVRLLVTSAAFKRSSKVTPELLTRDPENRLLARGPRVRLDAEQVRDNALAVSGLIDLTMGGRGVKPYQPPNIWEPVAFTGSNTRSYVQDHGPALYRRSLYVFLKRTAPAPFMANFDAPSREAFCARRERSNTPLQALQLMNDVQHVEAARALAERVLTEAGPAPADRVAHAFRLVLARSPEADESALLVNESAKLLSRFRQDPAAARELIAVGESRPKAGIDAPELAAWTLVANTLLNLDETVTRN